MSIEIIKSGVFGNFIKKTTTFVIGGIVGFAVSSAISERKILQEVNATEMLNKYMYEDLHITAMVEKADKNKNKILETSELVQLLNEVNYEILTPIPEHVIPYFEKTVDKLSGEVSIKMKYGHAGPILEVKLPEQAIMKYLRN
ncbi:hypothetical protein HYV79_01100 [Candidatus Woesearchaeota archaeon]|nr:hypothetical protein [Candidatus Woesearchaeota archaeon]